MPYQQPATPGQSSCSSVSNGRTLIGDADYFPCGPVNETTTAVPCCKRNDTCLEGGLCSHKGPNEDSHEDSDEDDPGTTSYYASGCTDPSFADPACKKLCTSLIAGDVTYNGTGWCWQCCANHYEIDCSKPLSDETFNLPPPNEIKSYFQIPATGVAFTSAAAPTRTPSSSLWAPEATDAAVPAYPDAPAPPEGPLGQSAAAGLGVGVTASAAFIAWAAWFLVRRRRAKRAGEPAMGDEPAESPGSNPFATPQTRHTELESPVTKGPRVEMTSHPCLAPELPGSLAIYELDGHPPSRGESPPPSPLSPVKEEA